MKRTLFALMLLATSVRGFGDGTFSARNLGGSAILDEDHLSPLSKAVGRVEILDGTTVLASGNLVKDGFFALGVVYDPNPASTVDITVRAWDPVFGATYSAAVASGRAFGSVLVRGVRLASGTTPPLDLTQFGMGELRLRFYCVLCPEPKSVTLACAGLGGLLLLGRRFSGS
jgi:hypothetical protein